LRLPLGWQQLVHKPIRLAVALMGIAFAVLLIMMQLGFRSALFESAVRFQERLNYDIALFSPDSVFIVRPQEFSIRRIYQALGDDDIDSVSPVYIFPAVWKNPWDNSRRSINAIGFDPNENILTTTGFSKALGSLSQQDTVFFDGLARPEFGPVETELNLGNQIITEINNREMKVVGTFQMGTSFGIDGTVMMSEDNWLRIFPSRSRNQIQLGLLQVSEGAQIESVRDRLRDYLPKDVLVLTKEDFIARERAYWNGATPIGYIFAFGAIMGLVVGAIIVYQILFADVSEHLNEYATLRAMGFNTSFITGIVIQQSLILGILGFIPGFMAASSLYSLAGEATSLPLYATMGRTIFVFCLTIGMCTLSALLAIRKVARLDPAEIF